MILLVLLLLVMAALFALFTWLEWDKHKGIGIMTLVIGIAVTGYTGWMNWATSFSNERTVVCNVTGKDRGGDGSSYRVYTDNCGQLVNEDDWYRWKTNSADVWQRIPDEGLVELHYVGIRWSLTNTFPNILDAQPVN
jgi:hypothetical protein